MEHLVPPLRPGRALAAIARASVPIVGAERFALRDPETGVAQANQPVF